VKLVDLVKDARVRPGVVGLQEIERVLSQPARLVIGSRQCYVLVCGHYGLRITDYGLRITDWGLGIGDCDSLAVGSIFDGFRSTVQVSVFRFQ